MDNVYRVRGDCLKERILNQITEVLRNEQVLIAPTETSYSFCCGLEKKKAITRIRQIRCLNKKHMFTLMCSDFSQLSNYAYLDNVHFRLVKRILPGAYTVILKAKNTVPKQFCHPKRKTVGVRIPNHAIMQSILSYWGEPLLTSSFILPDSESETISEMEAAYSIRNQVGMILDDNSDTIGKTTVLDLTQDEPIVVRQGIGDLDGVF